LESDVTGSTSPSTVEAKPKSSLKIAAIAMVIIAVVVSALLVGILFLKPSGQSAWLFKGAYAEYEGSTTMNVMTINVSVDFAVRQEVLDFNSTHAKISTYFKMGSSFGEAVENETAVWVPLSQVGFANAFDEANLTKSYESTEDIAGFGTKNCMVYEYAISDEGLSMTVYVDKQIGWPLKMTVSMGSEYSLDINLVDTNIPGLK
jgi:hypothetical protein